MLSPLKSAWRFHWLQTLPHLAHPLQYLSTKKQAPLLCRIPMKSFTAGYCNCKRLICVSSDSYGVLHVSFWSVCLPVLLVRTLTSLWQRAWKQLLLIAYCFSDLPIWKKHKRLISFLSNLLGGAAVSAEQASTLWDALCFGPPPWQQHTFSWHQLNSNHPLEPQQVKWRGFSLDICV